VLKGIDGVSFTFFGAKDVVRHPLVHDRRGLRRPRRAGRTMKADLLES
jgi:phosphate starvation-inducible protein PhoH